MQLPRHVAVLGAAGGLGKGVLSVCRAEGIGFTAIVRSRPERIGDVPTGSRVSVVSTLADLASLAEAFEGSDAVLVTMGVTPTSQDRSALLSANLGTVRQAMLAAHVDRLLVMNTLLSTQPGAPPSRAMRFFAAMPGTIGRGAREQLAMGGALSSGAAAGLRWTLVRGGVNRRGSDERPVASREWRGAANSWMPVSYEAMGRWMLEEAVANEHVHAAPLVSRSKATRASGPGVD